MTRTLPAACAALAFGFAAALAAQTNDTNSTTAHKHSTTRAGKNITVTGCLDKNSSGEFTLTNASVGRATGTSGTAKSKSSVAGDDTRTWKLENGKDLNKYVGHKVLVTGQPDATTSSHEEKGTSGTSGSESSARDLDVKSVRSLSSSCS
jgi:hypothetical protein